MALQTIEIDPTAQPDMTGNEIIAAINSGTSGLTRFGCLDQTALKIVRTAPLIGEYHVRNMHRNVTGNFEVEYDDVPVS